MDDLQRTGAAIRAVRIRRGWTQSALAARASVHRSVVSRIERGHLEGTTVWRILAVAKALDMRVRVTPSWRAGDLDRLLNGGHSRLHESVAAWFSDELPEWILAPEVSFAIYGERGVIDIMAWHPGRRALLIIELKTDVVDVNDLVGTMDRRRRLARQIARERGWDPATVSCWVIVAAGRTNQARLTAHRAMLRNAFPADGRTMQGWLRNPTGPIGAVSLWWRRDGTAHRSAAMHRVRGVGTSRTMRA
jgi:transcriptional regulator with XRE-family HTH domain